MGAFEMVVAIVFIATVGQIVRMRFKGGGGQIRLADDPEAQRMRDEIKALKERVAVLERIATDRNHALEHEIDLLRDR